ncbi:hypothetical protein ACHAWF_003946, partial [Thalassiosira exigua]
APPPPPPPRRRRDAELLRTSKPNSPPLPPPSREEAFVRFFRAALRCAQQRRLTTVRFALTRFLRSPARRAAPRSFVLFRELPEVTHKVYLDVLIDEEEPIRGRIVIGLFGNAAPKTAENFRSLCACDKGRGEISGKPLCYAGSSFHRIIPNFMIQGGDITEDNGVGGESIYGGYFEDETFEVKHNKLYLVSMANKGPNTNGSQFFINTVKTSWLDGKNVAFGMVLSGFDVVDDIEANGTNPGEPLADAIVESSGELPLESSSEDEE